MTENKKSEKYFALGIAQLKGLHYLCPIIHEKINIMATSSILYGDGFFKKVDGRKYFVSIDRMTENTVSEGKTITNEYLLNVDGRRFGVEYVTTQKRGVVSGFWMFNGKSYKSQLSLIKGVLFDHR